MEVGSRSVFWFPQQQSIVRGGEQGSRGFVRQGLPSESRDLAGVAVGAAVAGTRDNKKPCASKKNKIHGSLWTLPERSIVDPGFGLRPCPFHVDLNGGTAK